MIVFETSTNRLHAQSMMLCPKEEGTFYSIKL